MEKRLKGAAVKKAKEDDGMEESEAEIRKRLRRKSQKSSRLGKHVRLACHARIQWSRIEWS